jgi:hypothetical protein
MHDVLFLVVPWIVRIAASFAVVFFDERRLTERQLERAWPPSSRNAAVFAFDVVAVPIHFIKTRWSPWGLVLAVLWTAVVLAVTFASVLVLALATGEPLD